MGHFFGAVFGGPLQTITGHRVGTDGLIYFHLVIIKIAVSLVFVLWRITIF